MKIMVVNGPNINMLGIRQKDVYGAEDYLSLCRYIEEEALRMSDEVTVLQSNSEGGIIDFLQKAYFEKYDGVIINPGAYTHYSHAIGDAIRSLEGIPVIEIHLTNIHGRDEFRRQSVTAPACVGQICGFGRLGYKMAIEALQEYTEKRRI